MRIHISLIGLISFFAATAFAQWAGSRSIGATSPSRDRDGVVRGQVYSDNPIVGSLMVELVSAGRAGTVSTPLEVGGEFEFRGLTPGQYELRLTGAAGTVVHEESVLIKGGYQNLSIQMPSTSKAGRSTDATVSIRQLQHKVPGEAQKEFDRGMRASTKGDQSNAFDHFQKAARLDPEFADAFNGMGVTYVALGQLQQAVDQFQKTIDLVPDHPRAAANLSIVLCRLEHYHEAAEVARQALKLDPSLSKIRYVLGVSLVSEGADKAEALDNLQRAATEIPRAHLLVAKILEETDRREDAVTHVVEYLRSSPADALDRQGVEAWLEQLRH
jgi:tetratricopeptide (TPR) repeat protein